MIPDRFGILPLLGRLIILLIPTVLLLGASLRSSGSSAHLLWLGTFFQALGFLLALGIHQSQRGSVSPSVVMLYVIGLSWLVLGGSGREDWYFHLAQAVLLVIPLGFFAVQYLRESGAPTLRRARQLAQRLAARTDWPADLRDCRLLPEVKALREALHIDASPALNLLSHSSPRVRVAALAALEFRPSWRKGQAEVVLKLAQKAAEQEVRAAAINALANVEDRVLIEALAEFLNDRSALVRHTATEALLWDTERRWPWIRMAIRAALANPSHVNDGALQHENSFLTADALADLTAWAAEKGVLGLRSSLTLSVHYNNALNNGGSTALVKELRKQLADAHAPAMLRLELARLLNHHQELDTSLLQELLDPSNPAPLRLIAAEALLTGPTAAEAQACLRELARLPNREIALATAEIVQRRLGVDLGLTPGQPLPNAQNRAAAEVVRRLLLWTNRQTDSDRVRLAAQREADFEDLDMEPARADEPVWRPLSEPQD
jgi:hypothetical protein